MDQATPCDACGAPLTAAALQQGRTECAPGEGHRAWVELGVCDTCMVAASGVLEVNSDHDWRSYDALGVWAQYHLWVDCSGDGCESTHSHLCDCADRDPDGETPCADGHHSGGFTHGACDMCGVHGFDSNRVYAEPAHAGAYPLRGPGPIRKLPLRVFRHSGDEVTNGIAVEDIDYASDDTLVWGRFHFR